MHLRYGGIYNNHIIANCSQSVSVKKIENRSLIGEDMDKSKVPRFYGPPCIWAKWYTVFDGVSAAIKREIWIVGRALRQNMQFANLQPNRWSYATHPANTNEDVDALVTTALIFVKLLLSLLLLVIR